LLNTSSGALITAGVLIMGIVSFKNGNKRMSQQMMRARVVAQLSTCAAIGYGTYKTQMTPVDEPNP